MTELNDDAVLYALERYTDAVNELLGVPLVSVIDSDVPKFINDYNECEENNWPTTQA